MTHIRLIENGFLGLACIALLAACGVEDAGPVVSPELEAMQADQVIFNLEYVLQVNGVREAIVKADTSYHFRDSTVVYLRGSVELKFFDDQTGTARAVLTADRARLDQADRAVTAVGGAVLVVVEIDREIRSEEIHYAPQRNRVWSDSATCSREGDKVVEGSGFSANLDFTLVEVTNPRSRAGGDCR
ncbi:MAG: LPS export ABC transporter periplasmic protein LptC [Longimicrobiales bacterium]